MQIAVEVLIRKAAAVVVRDGMPMAQIQKIDAEVVRDGWRWEQILKVDAEVVKDMAPRVQIRKAASEEAKDAEPKVQMQGVAEELSIQKVAEIARVPKAHPWPNARRTYLKRSRLPQNAVPRTPKLLRCATATSRGGCLLLAEEALIVKDGAPMAQDQKVNAEAEQCGRRTAPRAVMCRQTEAGRWAISTGTSASSCIRFGMNRLN